MGVGDHYSEHETGYNIKNMVQKHVEGVYQALSDLL